MKKKQAKLVARLWIGSIACMMDEDTGSIHEDDSGPILREMKAIGSRILGQHPPFQSVAEIVEFVTKKDTEKTAATI